jgi:hypothetical protein
MATFVCEGAILGGDELSERCWIVEVAATDRERGVRRGLKVRAKREENSLAVEGEAGGR